jgi:hypothetical protein
MPLSANVQRKLELALGSDSGKELVAAVNTAGGSVTNPMATDLDLDGNNITDVNSLSTVVVTGVQTINGSGGIVVNSGGFLSLTDSLSVEGDVSLGISSTKIGFYGATTQNQQVLATGAGKTVDNVITFLQLIGLCKQS